MAEKSKFGSLVALEVIIESQLTMMIILLKRIHPDWTPEQIIEFLDASIAYAVGHQ